MLRPDIKATLIIETEKGVILQIQSAPIPVSIIGPPDISLLSDEDLLDELRARLLSTEEGTDSCDS